MTRRGFASEKSVEELLAVIDRARSFNLTHITDNIRHKPSFICNCCRCCCELLAGVQTGTTAVLPGPALPLSSKRNVRLLRCLFQRLQRESNRTAARGVLAEGREQVCRGSCGDLPRLRRLRIGLQKGSAHHGASRQTGRSPALKRKDLYVRILKEKGRLTPYVVSGIKKKLRNILLGKGRKEMTKMEE